MMATDLSPRRPTLNRNAERAWTSFTLCHDNLAASSSSAVCSRAERAQPFLFQAGCHTTTKRLSAVLIRYIMSKKRILIVEDEALTVLALKHELAELGYEIAGDASTAADALRAAEDNRADLVLMDIQLDGGINGIAAAAAI